MSIPAIEWEDGYPTEESIDAVAAIDNVGWTAAIEGKLIQQWLRDTLSHCAENCCASYSEEDGETSWGEPVLNVHFSTGGWSGAEDIIGLIERTYMLQYYMVQWRRGGHYIFEFKKP